MKQLSLLKFASPALLALSLSACVGGGDSAGADSSSEAVAAGRDYPEQPRSCEVDEMRNWVNANMNDYYLFYDQVPKVDLEQYSDLQDLINALAVQPFDRFSYISDAQQSSALFEEGISFGFGWRLSRTTESDVQFAYVYPRSPVAATGIERGDFLLAINGVHPLDMTNDQWDEFLGTDNEVVTPTLTVLDKDGLTRTVEPTKTNYELDTVLEHRVMDSNNGKVGYMAFTSFLETSNEEIDTAFSEFESAGINDLVLDLRYNGGGRISVANKLASKIVGAEHAGQVFAEIAYNEKYAAGNAPYNLVVPSIALNLPRLIVLSSASTCSASEMIINGLKPFIDVVQIGGTSCGKPYGSAPHEACGKAMNALQFRFVNANGVGDYYDGIAANCPATDDVNHALGDANEGMLAAALGYIESGSCQTGIASRSLLRSATKSSSLVHNIDPLKSESNIYD